MPEDRREFDEKMLIAVAKLETKQDYTIQLLGKLETHVDELSKRQNSQCEDCIVSKNLATHIEDTKDNKKSKYVWITTIVGWIIAIALGVFIKK